MKLDIQLSRRRWLAVTGTAVGGALAGCSSDGTPSPTPGRPAVVDTSFDGTDLVVELLEDHQVKELTLIAPDGSRFAETAVADGETTARLEILAIKPHGAGFKHYTPGVHELVAVSEGEEETTTLELRPDLRIVDVRQYREGDDASDYGKLVVEVENVGTGPTWVYSVIYRDSPNSVADDEFGGDSGINQLEFPSNPLSSIIVPGEKQDFVGIASPIILSDSETQECSGTARMSVFIESPAFDTVEKTVQVTFDGSVVSVGLTGEYACTSTMIEENPG